MKRCSEGNCKTVHYEIALLHINSARLLQRHVTSGVQLACMSAASSDDFKQVVEAMLEPISKVCLEKLSQTRCASKINRDDLRDVRKAFRTILQIHGAESDAFVKEEEFW